MYKIKLSFLSLFLCFIVFQSTAQENKKKYFDLPTGYSATRDVVYSSGEDYENKLDIYWMPENEKPLPLIIWVHGGAWRSGDKRSARFARELLGKGYAVASINYRLSGQAKFPTQIIDCKAAIRWLRANAQKYHIDPERFAAWGGSAGAHLVALLGTAENMEEWEKGENLAYSSRVQAVVDWFGPTDFSRMDDEPGKMIHLEAGSPESQLLGAAVKDHPEKVAYANPITYVSKNNPPFQIFHGKDDQLVLPNQAILLNDAFQKIGLIPDFALLDSTGHGGQEWNRQIPKAKQFLDKHLIQEFKKPKPDADSIPRQRRWTNSYFFLPDHLQYQTFISKTIRQQYGYMIYLPPGYQNFRKKYPVIYWLPGRGGNPKGVAHYINLYHKAILENNAPEAIIVGVNGINSSMYTNNLDSDFPIASVIINDLIPHIDTTYRTINNRKMRAIDGFSMGGFGAAKLGFSHPETFGVISIIGGALHRPEVLASLRADIYQQVFNSNLAYCQEQSPWTILQKNANKLQKDIYIRQFIGENDEILLEKNKEFHQLLDSLGIAHEFGIIKNAKHNYSQVYENWKGNPFEFYQKAFSEKVK